MTWILTDITCKHDMSSTMFNTISGATVKTNDPSTVTIDATIKVLEYNQSEIESLSAIEDALKDTKRIHPNAPSYREYLKKYNPEFLL